MIEYYYQIDDIQVKKLMYSIELNDRDKKAIDRLAHFVGTLKDVEIAIRLYESIGEQLLADNLRKILVTDAAPND